VADFNSPNKSLLAIADKVQPAFPAPSDLGGQDDRANLARMRGEIAKLCRLTMPAV
jgi:hypothetical protein